MKGRITLTICLALSACTAVSVDPVSSTTALDIICIVDNPKVAVKDFVSVVETRFAHHGVTTKLVSSRDDCPITLDYTAERSWDLKPFLNYALLTLRDNGTTIGKAEYRHKGGFALTKFAGTATKMNPVIDELLGYKI